MNFIEEALRPWIGTRELVLIVTKYPDASTAPTSCPYRCDLTLADGTPVATTAPTPEQAVSTALAIWKRRQLKSEPTVLP